MKFNASKLWNWELKQKQTNKNPNCVTKPLVKPDENLIKYSQNADFQTYLKSNKTSKEILNFIQYFYS